MADENISDAQRKLSAAMQQQADDYARYGQMQVSTSEQLRDAQFQAATGLKNLSPALNLAGKGIGALAGAGVAAAAAMYEGKKGMGAFNSSLDSLSEAATIAGAALTLLIPGGIVMKAIIGGLTMAATAAIAYTKAANDMSDKLYKSYSGLAKSGGAAADGMTGVFRDAKKLGLSMNELDSMVALIAANSQDLAMFAGTVSEGREKLADMSKAIEGSRAEFFKMGLSQTDINEGMGDYLRVVTRTGRAQTMTTEQLASSARNYITEQDQLAKITGISVKQQQANIEKALANEMFQSKIRSLEAEGKTGAADELKKLNAYYSQMGEESAKGFQDSVNGNLRSKEAQKLNLASQGEVLRSTQDVIANNATAAQAFDRVAGRVKETEETIGRTQAAFGTTADSNLKYSEQVNFANAANGKSREQLEKITAAQIAKQKAGADEMTNNQGNIIKTQQEANEALERFTAAGIPNAQAAMETLAKATLAAAKTLQGLAESKLGKQGKTQTLDQAKQTHGTTTQTALEAADKARETAADANATKEQKEKAQQAADLAAAESQQTAREQREAQLREANERRKKQKAERAAGALSSPAPPSPGGVAPAAPAAAPAAAAAPASLSTAGSAHAGQGGTTPVQGGSGRGGQGGASAPAAPIAAAGATVAAANAELEKYTKITGAKSKSLGALAENITKFESGKAGYNAYNRGTIGNKMIGSDKPIDFSKMTIAEYLKHGKLKSGDPDKIFAVGKYQIIPGTMEGLVKKLKLDPEKTYLDAVTQDLLFNEGLIKQSRPNAAAYLQGKSNDRDLAILDMAKEFASVGVPYPAGKAIARGESYYAGIGGNKAHNSPELVGAALDADRKSLVSAAEGGLFSGPDSGYPATLHGREAVIPLENGGGNFVQLFEQMAMMMGQQANSLDELVRIAKSGNDISTKILRQQA